jgi:hypothetical protein
MKVFSVCYISSLLCTASACAHDKAWIASRDGNGGRIGYYQSTFSDDRDAVVRNFNKAAMKICGSPK